MTTTTTSTETAVRPDVRIVTQTASGNPAAIVYSADQTFSLVQSVTKGDSPREWKANIKNCLSATSYLSGVTRTYDFPSCTAHRDDIVTSGAALGKNRRRTLIGAIQGSGTIPSVSTQLLDETTRVARALFLKRAIGAQQKIQSLVALGEIGETARMIKGVASLLHHGLWDYLATLKKRRKRSKPKKKTKEIIAETWLEYSFGWQPLLNDIDGAAQALAEARVNASKRFERITARASLSSKTASVRTIHEYPGGTPAFIVHRNATHSNSCQVRFSGGVNLQPPGTNAFTNQFGLRLRDIVPSLWELIPYSFMVDYFTNVGDIISAAAFGRSDLRWVEYGWKHDSVNTSVVDKIDYPALTGHKLSSSYYLNPEMQRLASTTVFRDVDFGSFIPPLTFSVPGLNSRKWLNILALKHASRRTSKELSAY